jgi:hypothetical protein
VVGYRSGREKVMYSARRSILAVALLFTTSISGTAAFPQAAKFIHHAADSLTLTNVSAGRAPCTRESDREVVTSYAAAATSGRAGLPCDAPATIMPSIATPSVNACSPSNPAQAGCNPPKDPVQEYLASLGRPGQKILRAREKALEILQTDNSCSAWFREKDPNPADIFRTLNYAVDRQGAGLILESRDSGMTIFRYPYVAEVFQGDGRYATITINANGAFFNPMVSVVEVWKDGGPVANRTPRATGVGPYGGDTMHAQVLVLLHEFGHLVDLLPSDENDVDGKSVQNTNEVLRFCRAEVESRGKRATLSARR